MTDGRRPADDHCFGVLYWQLATGNFTRSEALSRVGDHVGTNRTEAVRGARARVEWGPLGPHDRRRGTPSNLGDRHTLGRGRGTACAGVTGPSPRLLHLRRTDLGRTWQRQTR